LGAAKDESGSILKELVGEEGGKGAKVIVWAAGEEKGKLYDGELRFILHSTCSESFINAIQGR
jgi:hypothetical protein